MAEKHAMTTAFVIDTSYLLELFAVPDFSEPRAILEVKRRYEEALEEHARLYVPLPCLFELGNHIADVRDGNVRHRLANQLTEQVSAAIEGVGDWILLPPPDVLHFRRSWEQFAQEFARQGFGLTNTCVIDEARRLKRERYRGALDRVHIWTRHETLKTYEPDREANPFVR